MTSTNPPSSSTNSNASPIESITSQQAMLAMQNMMSNPWLAMNPFQMFQSHLQSNSPWPQQLFQSNASGLPGSSEPMQKLQSQPDIPQQNLPLNPLAFLPAHLSNEVLRLSLPVGSSPDDESMLVKTLHECSKKGGNYRLAMESLHGKNCHSSSIWKDFYLDNKSRIDKLVSDYDAKTIKKPRLTSSPLPGAPQAAARSHFSPEPRKRRRSLKSEDSSFAKQKRSRHLASSSASRGQIKRATINSITAHSPPQFVRNLTPPHADLKIPSPPSRSPTPPTRVVSGIRGNRYTEEDQKFFIDFITYELNRNSDLTKNELTDMLHLKCPHHSAGSWANWWARHHDLPDKIFAAFHGEDESTHSESSYDTNSENNSGSWRKDEIDPDESAGEGSSKEGPNSDYADGATSGSDSDKPCSTDKMGESGEAFTKADLHMAAKHLASLYHSKLSKSEIWKLFSKKHPQRSDKSWGEFHRRYEQKLDKLAKRYRDKRSSKRGESTASSQGKGEEVEEDGYSSRA